MANPENVLLETNGWIAPPDNAGSNWTSPWTVQLDFEGAAGTSIPTSVVNSAKAMYSDAIAPQSGTTCGSVEVLQDQESGSGWSVSTPKAYRGSQVWVRGYCFFPTGFEFDGFKSGQAKSVKFFRIRPTAPLSAYVDLLVNNDPNFPNDAYYFTYEGDPPQQYFGDLSTRPPLNQWTSFECSCVFDSTDKDSGGLAEWFFWIDGVLQAHYTNRTTLPSITDNLFQFHLMSFWNAGSIKTQTYYFDNFTITTETPSTTDAQGNPCLSGT